MEQILEILFTETWAIRALIASMIVGLTCGVLGCFVVLRNMSLVGDALAHSILPGVVFAFILVGYSALGFFAGAVIASFLTAIGITWIQHNIKTKNDAAIGIVFTAMFSIGVMGISFVSKSGGVHLDLKDFLFGNVLGVSNQDLYLTAFIAVYVFLSIIIFYRYLFATTFQPVIAETMGISVRMVHYFVMLLLSFTVVASLQTVGVILVVAMLITPASTALLLSDRLKYVLLISAFLGLISAVIGLIVSIALQTTPGPAMAVTATVIYLLVAMFAPRKGLISRSIRKSRQNRKINLEDILKQSLKLNEKGKLNVLNLTERITFGHSKLHRYLKYLNANKLIKMEENGALSMTPAGIEEANQLVRAHRLWETYLVARIGLTEEQIHEDAEKYEHLLTEEILDEVDASLGYPRTDPHGSPIPYKKGWHKINPLSNTKIGQTAVIANDQPQQIISRLWEMRLSPADKLEVTARNEEAITIQWKEIKLKIPNSLAEKINIEN
ncbi:MAG: metal ABC transporter permease [Bacteroidia bacterium]|nr:metal ABC transporter permease [Bacteroidia bacterium]